jgi:hypothetical protein
LIERARHGRVHTLEIDARSDEPWIQSWYGRLGFISHEERTYPDGEQVVVMQMPL